MRAFSVLLVKKIFTETIIIIMRSKRLYVKQLRNRITHVQLSKGSDERIFPFFA